MYTCIHNFSILHKMNNSRMLLITLPYTAKYLRGKTFVFRVENGYSLENVCGSMLVHLYCQWTRP